MQSLLSFCSNSFLSYCLLCSFSHPIQGRTNLWYHFVYTTVQCYHPIIATLLKVIVINLHNDPYEPFNLAPYEQKNVSDFQRQSCFFFFFLKANRRKTTTTTTATMCFSFLMSILVVFFLVFSYFYYCHQN